MSEILDASYNAADPFHYKHLMEGLLVCSHEIVVPQKMECISLEKHRNSPT